jgi:hypothetical protein
MRPALLATLFGIGLLTLGLRSQSTADPVARPVRAAAASKIANPPTSKPTWSVAGGWEGSSFEAQQSALEAARVEVIAFLRSQHPPNNWTPSRDYVQTYLVKTPWKEEAKPILDEKGEPLGTAYQVQIQVEITPSALQDMEARGQACRVQNRMLGLGKVLLALMALLAVVTGCLRLDERTKGYYTRWLTLGAVGLVGLAWLGLILLA